MTFNFPQTIPPPNPNMTDTTPTISPATTPPKRGRPKKYTSDEERQHASEAVRKAKQAPYKELLQLDKTDPFLSFLKHVGMMYAANGSTRQAIDNPANRKLLWDAVAQLQWHPIPAPLIPL